MTFAQFSRRATGGFPAAGAALLALLAASCTSTGTGPDGKPMQMSAATGSMVADTLQSAADQKTEQEAQTAEAQKPGEQKPGAAQPAGKAEAAALPVPGQPPAKTAVAPTTVAATDPAQKPAESAKPVQVASLYGLTKTDFATPQKPAAAQAGIQRLFSDGQGGRKTAVAKAVVPAAQGFNDALPGVRPYGGLEIKHRNSLNDDADIDANEDDQFARVTLASAPGLGRLVPNGLRVQRETVDVACLKPSLVAMLKTMERHFGRPVMVTSGYRSPSYNRKVNGARHSLHMICAAADIQIDGISKWEIARYARAMQGRGGVGTYCHTQSVHVDIGPERDWNWRC